jgi:hypothetical protein
MTKRLLWVWVFLATFFLVSCDHESTVKVFVTGPDASVSQPAPAVNVPPLTVNVEAPITNLLGPELPACEKPGRGIGRGRGLCK